MVGRSKTPNASLFAPGKTKKKTRLLLLPTEDSDCVARKRKSDPPGRLNGGKPKKPKLSRPRRFFLPPEPTPNPVYNERAGKKPAKGCGWRNPNAVRDFFFHRNSRSINFRNDYLSQVAGKKPKASGSPPPPIATKSGFCEAFFQSALYVEYAHKSNFYVTISFLGISK